MKITTTFIIYCLLHLSAFCDGGLSANSTQAWQKFNTPNKRALWVWSPTKQKMWDGEKKDTRWNQNYKNCHDLLIDFAHNKSIRVLYLYIGSWHWSNSQFIDGQLQHEKQLANLIRKANKKGIQVWAMYYINDSPEKVKPGIEGIKHIIDCIAAFNKKFPDAKFAGIQSDQEPNKSENWHDLMRFLTAGQEHVDKVAPKLIFSQTLKPSYIREDLNWNGTNKKFYQHILDTIDHVALMAYNNNPTVAYRWSEAVCQYATEVKKKASIGFETDDLSHFNYDASMETWCEQILEEEKRFDGSAGSFEATMQDFEKKLAQFDGFDRMVIHSYRSYFSLWFSNDGSYEPADHPSSWPKPPAVRLEHDLRPLFKK